MIGIKSQTTNLVIKHYEAIRDFLSNTKRIKYNYKTLDQWMLKITNDNFNLEQVIKAKPGEIKLIIEEVEKNVEIDLLTKEEGKTTNYEKGQYFLHIYEKFSTRGDKHFKLIGYNALLHITSLDINVCPYCNRNFINNTKLIDKNKNSFIKRTAQLDHFYPESKYPYLAISFYNLIPVCGTCNMIKLDEHLGINPYEISNSDEHLIFDYSFDESINKLKVDTLDMSKQFLCNWETLGLEELYKIHDSYVEDLLMRIKLYNSVYRKDLTNYFDKWSGKTEIPLTKGDFDRVILGNYYLEKDLSKFPLSKLTKDIVRRYK
ncbi:TPA: hypothetical protein QCP98_002144 [Bacillus cereus]|uniref:hypothetical protein n=1 Tax=Bacillus thuringiensis TaxID=1428 RepID=UPI000BFE0E13|nr:hypothetical protein [Bacillus thuringiensis]PGP44869.1 hypothetical protein COA06_18410 [Bacillus thuringiensis]PGR48652.1 hypothetical protein COC57_10400 [Bacillus thuringiensis]HDR4461384.1 hypothetical protein [Bacillus cereus]